MSLDGYRLNKEGQYYYLYLDNQQVSNYAHAQALNCALHRIHQATADSPDIITDHHRSKEPPGLTADSQQRSILGDSGGVGNMSVKAASSEQHVGAGVAGVAGVGGGISLLPGGYQDIGGGSKSDHGGFSRSDLSGYKSDYSGSRSDQGGHRDEHPRSDTCTDVPFKLKLEKMKSPKEQKTGGQTEVKKSTETKGILKSPSFNEEDRKAMTSKALESPEIQQESDGAKSPVRAPFKVRKFLVSPVNEPEGGINFTPKEDSTAAAVSSRPPSLEVTQQDTSIEVIADPMGGKAPTDIELAQEADPKDMFKAEDIRISVTRPSPIKEVKRLLQEQEPVRGDRTTQREGSVGLGDRKSSGSSIQVLDDEEEEEEEEYDPAVEEQQLEEEEEEDMEDTLMDDSVPPLVLQPAQSGEQEEQDINITESSSSALMQQTAACLEEVVAARTAAAAGEDGEGTEGEPLSGASTVTASDLPPLPQQLSPDPKNDFSDASASSSRRNNLHR